jgi:hypothetical protein
LVEELEELEELSEDLEEEDAAASITKRVPRQQPRPSNEDFSFFDIGHVSLLLL